MGSSIRKRKVTLLIIPYDHRRMWKFTISNFMLYGMVFSILLIAIWASLVIVEEIRSFPLKQVNQFLIAELESIQKYLHLLDSRDQQMKLLLGIEDRGYQDGEKEETEVKEDNVLSSPALVQSEFERIRQQAREYERSFRQIEELFKKQKSLLAATPSIWPTRGWVNSGFGLRISPFTGRWEMHEGIDIANNVGTPVVSTADGIVKFVGRYGGYGITLIIVHGYGYSTLYGHLSQVRVRPGQRVKRHQVIALMGNTGRSTGPHLHYEIRINDKPVAPRHYILD